MTDHPLLNVVVVRARLSLAAQLFLPVLRGVSGSVRYCTLICSEAAEVLLQFMPITCSCGKFDFLGRLKGLCSSVQLP